jgi:tRNA (guanine37-N1)-methyltransferase
MKSLPHSIDFVGDIAILELPKELEQYGTIIGQAVLKMNKNVHTVLAKAGIINGTYRLRNYLFLAGQPKTDTVHTEYGCRYHVNLATAYFSPRLSYEHSRVASKVKQKETIIDLFAGVGPFSILIAKTHPDAQVHAVDLNPQAIQQLKQNIRLNRLTGKVHPHLGDARNIINTKLKGTADRVIMNLPEKAIDYLDTACQALKPEGGTLHFYCFTNKTDNLTDLKKHFKSKIEQSGRKVDKILCTKTVRETAPYEWQTVIDAKIR